MHEPLGIRGPAPSPVLSQAWVALGSIDVIVITGLREELDAVPAISLFPATAVESLDEAKAEWKRV